MKDKAKGLRYQLRNVERGYAEVWAVNDEHPNLADLGDVSCRTWTGSHSNVNYTKWFAYHGQERVGIHYATRQAAARALFARFVKSLSRRQRRELGITLADVG